MTASKLLISFSGGRSSAFMTHLLLSRRNVTYEDIVVVFANTGWEHPDTLDFVNALDLTFGWDVIWLEAVVHSGTRKSSTYKIVTYETASRNGEPYEQVILPSISYPHCTRELKINPMHSFVKEHLGWKKKTYVTAIGIRADEENQSDIIYPLYDMGIDKEDVNLFWEEYPHLNLQIPVHLGNCLWCFKKSHARLKKVYKEYPEVFDWTKKMEEKYPRADRSPIFRGNRNTENLIASFSLGEDFPDAGCIESCEVV